MTLYLLITTWLKTPERLGYLKRTIEALEQNLQFTGPIITYISREAQFCDLDTFKDYTQFLLDKSRSKLCPYPVVHTNPPGIGQHLNFFLSGIGEDEVFMYVQDDWVLNTSLDVTDDYILLKNPPPSLIQYRWWPEPAAYFERATAEHFIIPHTQKWLYTDTPFIARKDLFSRLGPFLAGSSEADMANRLRLLVQTEPTFQVWGRGNGNRHWVGDEYFTHIGEVSTVR